MSIYFLLGPEDGEKQLWLDREKKRIVSEYPDAEFYTFFGGEDEGENLTAILSQPSLFSSYRFVTVKHFENAKKTDSITLSILDFFKNPQEDVELVIISSDQNTSSFPSVMQKLPKDNIIIFYEMKEDQKKNWIRVEARREGYMITQAAVDEILSSVDNNTQEMKNLLHSIILFLRLSDKGESTIDVEEIETYAARTKGETGYTLFKAVAERDLEHALLIISSILLYDQREIIPAFSVLSNQFRLLEACHLMRKDRKSDQEIFKTVTYISTYSLAQKRSGIFFKDQETFRSGMKKYTLDEVRDIILYLGKMDIELKSAPTELAKTLYDSVIYHIVAEGGKENPITLEPPML